MRRQKHHRTDACLRASHEELSLSPWVPHVYACSGCFIGTDARAERVKAVVTTNPLSRGLTPSPPQYDAGMGGVTL